MPQHPLLRRWPLALLLVQILVVGAWLGANGRFRPVVVNDTPSYRDFPFHSLEAALGQRRTPGYPVFLRINHAFSNDLKTVPVGHFLVYAVAVLIFYRGLSKLTPSSMVAAAAASTLLYSRILHGYVDTIATDTLAAAAGIAVCGLALWRVAVDHWALTMCLVATSSFGWLIRPAYLFLVPFVPVLIWSLRRLSESAVSRTRWRSAIVLACLMTMPVIAYCSLRYVAVGRFGIVSFGGYNQIGVSGQFLRPEDLDELTDNLQPTAKTAIELRSSGSIPAGKFDDLPRLNYSRMEDRYDLTIWHEFTPAAERHVGIDPTAVNAELRRLATELIFLHPRDYAVWLAKATRQAAKKTLWDFADNPVTLALLLLGMLRVFRPNYLTANEAGSTALLEARALWVMALAYLTLSLAIVIPICPPLGRFTDAAAVMLACPLAVWLCGGSEQQPRRPQA